MKRSLVFFAIVFLLVGNFAFGDRSTLIDFSTLEPDGVANADGEFTEHLRTAMDYSEVSSINFNDPQKALMRTSLALPNWEVTLNSSARSVANMQKSDVRPAPVTSGPFEGMNVMGVRIEFPVAPVHSNARVHPAFDIPAFEPMVEINPEGKKVDGTQESGVYRFRKQADDEQGYGVIDNVGTIRSIQLTTYGNNFPHAIYVLLEDNDGIERRYYMGTLNFDGWKNLIWENPNYIEDIRNREIRLYPLYPRGLPFAKFTGLVIARDASHDGGPFIGYFKHIDLIYDKAIAQTERDIADEDLWGIVTEKEDSRQQREMSTFGVNQVTRFIENENTAKEEDFKSAVENPQNAETTVE